MNKHRLELFSDGIFAIVLTLLVLDLKVPAARGWTGAVQIAPALLVHAATFLIIGALWHLHHGAFARVTDITRRVILFNLLALFWVTLLPFGAKNAAEFPLDPLGASIIAADCGLYMASMMAARLGAHSAIDDNLLMRTWRRRRIWLGSSIALACLLGAGLAWISPWFGYGAAFAAVVVALVLSTPAEAEQRFERRAAGG